MPHTDGTAVTGHVVHRRQQLDGLTLRRLRGRRPRDHCEEPGEVPVRPLPVRLRFAETAVTGTERQDRGP